MIGAKGFDSDQDRQNDGQQTQPNIHKRPKRIQSRHAVYDTGDDVFADTGVDTGDLDIDMPGYDIDMPGYDTGAGYAPPGYDTGDGYDGTGGGGTGVNGTGDDHFVDHAADDPEPDMRYRDFWADPDNHVHVLVYDTRDGYYKAVPPRTTADDVVDDLYPGVDTGADVVDTGVVGAPVVDTGTGGTGLGAVRRRRRVMLAETAVSMTNLTSDDNIAKAGGRGVSLLTLD